MQALDWPCTPTCATRPRGRARHGHEASSTSAKLAHSGQRKRGLLCTATNILSRSPSPTDASSPRAIRPPQRRGCASDRPSHLFHVPRCRRLGRSCRGAEAYSCLRFYCSRGVARLEAGRDASTGTHDGGRTCTYTVTVNIMGELKRGRYPSPLNLVWGRLRAPFPRAEPPELSDPAQQMAPSRGSLSTP